MSALLFALALFAQDAEAAPPVAEPAPVELPFPNGAPKDDYGLVSWCHGALTGYLDLRDQVMPEVTRIETAFRAPGRTLAEDLKVYADLQRQGRRDLALFARAMEAAEKASLKPISPRGAEAVKRGRSTWAAAPNLPKARLAQEWMSWTLPARCAPTAQSLEQRAKLLGATFDANTDIPEEIAPEAPPAAPVELPSNPS